METQHVSQDAILIHVPPSCPPLPFHPVFQSNLVPVETQHDAILLHVTPPCPPHPSLTSDASNLAPLDCSAPDILVGGHAAAFTSPLAISLALVAFLI